MLFCMVVGSAWAEVNSELIYKTIAVGDDATTVVENQWYVLYNHNRKVCVSEETSAFKMRSVPANGTVAELNAGKLFKFIAVDGEEGQYYIVSGNGLYFDFVNNNSSTVSTNPVAYKVAQIGQNNGHFYIQHAENGYIADGQDNGDSFVCWEKNVPANAGGNNCYHFKPVTLTDVTLYNVTYNYYVDGVLKHTEMIENQLEGAAVSAPTFGYVTFEAPTGTISAENYIFDINCTLEETPIVFSADVNNPTWQIVEMHRGFGDRFWFYNASSKQVNVYAWATPYEAVNEGYWWCFVGDQFGFKIYNKAAGTEVTLNATSGTPTVGVASNGNDNWILAKSSYKDYQNDLNSTVCFTNDRKNYMNQQGGVAKYWTSNDNGSTCFIHSLSDRVKTATERIYAEVTSDIAGYVGSYTATSEQISELDKCKSAESFNVNEAKTIVDAILTQKVEMAPGYYFVKGTGSGNRATWYLSHQINKSKECLWAVAPTGKLNADFIWKFETCEDGYKMQCVNVGLYFQIKTATNGGDNNTYIDQNYTEGNKLLLTENGRGKFIIKNSSDQNIRTENGDATGAQVNYWSGENQETWYLIPATELEVEVANAYGSIYLPFDVTLADGQKAYAVTATSETSATLTEMEDIPAGEGAILAQGTYTLNIADATSDWADNKLEGTNVNTYIAGPAYVLGLVEGEVALAKAALNKDAAGAEGTTHFLNNANKAYLPVEEGASLVLRFNFDGNTTAIESVLNGVDANAPIYDLSGRRVVNAVKGGIYIQNGKKFIVK